MVETMLHPWETEAQTSVIPLDQDQIDRAFSDIMAPQMLSSGWICTLTIECGTFICACQ
nr:hypothetical protein [Propionicimonas sp.]